MITIDDEGEGGVFGPMMTSSQKFNFLANFWDFTGYILLKFSPKFSNSEKKFSSKFEVKPNCV